ncbi:RluA family pseudouridine synthase [Clostridium sp. MSJ-11]|uniref:Pseudouridine synthase n=1 Tax=Clostridium mobile TaxID=2841512 RepID=A0ABS6EGK9_9CLOT|nr:RluA family pseudouridine synthase [Clostridium mobile]MBU5483549.1 RluA family pseudouridine synthase [Clostridium mobile]
MSSKLNFLFEKDEEMPLKEYLKFHLKLSSRLIRGAIREDRIRVNGEIVKLSYKLKNGDSIDISIQKDEEQNIEPEKIDLDIVYEDEDIIVINKTYGMVVHPTKSYPNGTLANGLLYYFKSSGQNCIVRLVSRLDMDTSGLILVAKNQFAHMALARDMGEDSFKKWYLAVAHNKFTEKEGTINLPIYRTGGESIKRIVDHRGQESITHYKVIEEYTAGSLVQVLLETGRTHQIRVHLSRLGNPLYGDSLYGEEYDDDLLINRQALHAYKLSFPHPRTGEVISLECGLPEDIKKLIEELKKS